MLLNSIKLKKKSTSFLGCLLNVDKKIKKYTESGKEGSYIKKKTSHHEYIDCAKYK